MMNFKEWLQLNEVNPGSISTYLYKGPPTGDEWAKVASKPQHFEDLKKRIKAAQDLGAKLYNIDPKSFKTELISPKSSTLPDDKMWRHKGD